MIIHFKFNIWSMQKYNLIAVTRNLIQETSKKDFNTPILINT